MKDEINEQYDILAEDEERMLAEEAKERNMAGPDSEEAHSSQKKAVIRGPHSGQLGLQGEEELQINRDEDIYSMLATQSTLIEQLLKTSMF